jgi:hypothetical protein
MEKYKNRTFIIVLMCYIIIIIEHFAIKNGLNVSFGKDGGLVFRIATICFLGVFYFMFMDKPLSKYLIICAFVGFIVSLIACLIVFKINLFLGELINNEMGGLNISLIYLMFSSVTLIIVIGQLLSKFQDNDNGLN